MRHLIIFCSIISFLFFGSTYAIAFGKGERVKLECLSERYGEIQWHYDKKNIYEMYPENPRVYKIDSKVGHKISASSKSSSGMFYAVLDTINMKVSVQGPYGNYSNTECKQIN